MMQRQIKLIIFGLVFVLLISIANAALSPINYYPLKSNCSDVVSGYNFTNDGVSFDGVWGEFNDVDTDSCYGVNQNFLVSDTTENTFCINFETDDATQTNQALYTEYTDGDGIMSRLKDDGGGGNIEAQFDEWVNGECYTNTAITSNQNYTFCVVHTSGNINKVYLDGVNECNVTAAYSTDSGAYPPKIGGWGAGTSTAYAFDGHLWEFCVYNSTLTTEQIIEYDTYGCLGEPAAPPPEPAFDPTFPTNTFTLTTNVSSYQDGNYTDNPIEVSFNGSTSYDYSIPDYYAMWDFETNVSAVTLEVNNNFNATVYGATKNLSGHNGYGYIFDGTDDKLVANQENTQAYFDFDNITFMAWVYLNEPNDDGYILDNFGNSSYLGGLRLNYYEGNFYSQLVDKDYAPPTFNYVQRSSSAYSTPGWYHVAGRFIMGDTIEIYVNGVNDSTGSNPYDIGFSVTDINSSLPLYIGSTAINTTYWNGTIDEVRIYNRSLTPAQISAIYNSSYPKFACQLLDDAMIQDSSAGLNISSIDSLSIDTTGYEEAHILNLTCTDNFLTQSDQATDVFIDTVEPNIFQYNLTNNSIFYHNILQKVNITAQASDTNLYAFNASLFYLNSDGSINLTLNNTYADGITTTTYNITIIQNMAGLDNGRYEFRYDAYDGHTAKTILPYDFEEITDGFLIEDSISITSPEYKKFEFKKQKDRYTFDFKFKNDYPKIYVSCDDLRIVNDEYEAHLICWSDKKWIDFEEISGVHSTVTRLTPNTVMIEPQAPGKTDFSFNSIGDLNENHKSYYFNVTDGFTVYAQDAITSTDIDTFTTEVWQGGALTDNKSTITGNITFNFTGIYNLTTYSSDYATNITNDVSFTVNGSTTIHLFATNSLYLFIYDEIKDTLIDDRIVYLDIINYDNSSARYNTSTGTTFVSGFAPGNYEIRYFTDGYNTRSYYTTIVGSDTQSIELFSLNSSEATYTNFIIEDETGNTLEGMTLKGYRHFIDCNCFKVIEMDKSTFNGLATLSLQQQEARYKFIVTDTDGTTIYSSTSDEGYKITGTSYTLTATVLGDTTQSYFGTSGLYTNLSWNNNTKSFYYTINDNSGLVDQFCVFVDQYDLTQSEGKIQICSNCINSTTGTAICNVTAYADNGREMISRGWIHTNTQYSDYYTDVISVITNLESVIVFGKLGVFLGFIMILTSFFAGLVIAGVGGAFIFFIISMIFVSILKLIVISFPVILGISAISLIILFIMGERR